MKMYTWIMQDYALCTTSSDACHSTSSISKAQLRLRRSGLCSKEINLP